MPQGIVFLIMSARQPGPLVEQLVDTLAPNPVVIHHDFSKRADFRVDRPNVRLIPDPKLTGWGTWGFCEAILRSLKFCIDNGDYEYYQLISPTCLPIRPIREFEAHIAADQADVHADLIDIERDLDTWMSYTHRAHHPARSLRQTAALKFRDWYFGPNVRRVQQGSMMLRRHSCDATGQLLMRKRRAAIALARMAIATANTKHAYGPSFRPFVGSTWFGIKRRACEDLLRRSEDPALCEFFAKLSNTDEHFFPSLLGNSQFRVSSSNHAVSTFHPPGHPRCIGSDDLDRIISTGKFFARKFSDDPQDVTRHRVLRLLAAANRQ